MPIYTPDHRFHRDHYFHLRWIFKKRERARLKTYWRHRHWWFLFRYLLTGWHAHLDVLIEYDYDIRKVMMENSIKDVDLNLTRPTDEAFMRRVNDILGDRPSPGVQVSDIGESLRRPAGTNIDEINDVLAGRTIPVRRESDETDRVMRELEVIVKNWRPPKVDPAPWNVPDRFDEKDESQSAPPGDQSRGSGS